MGLPNKLGVLLHGQPGTGKSSCITAIATYLEKDIYYLSLNGIETNEELQRLFDHVMKNCINGGIIVFEDIDCSSPIVLKRSCETSINSISENSSIISTSDSENVSELVKDSKDKLTLAYFLNLLQGTLQQDGICFCMTTNYLDKLDPALYRPGRMDCLIEMGYCDKDMLKDIYQKFIERDLQDDLSKKLRKDITPAEFIFHIKDYSESDKDEEILDKFLN